MTFLLELLFQARCGAVELHTVVRNEGGSLFPEAFSYCFICTRCIGFKSVFLHCKTCERGLKRKYCET